MDIKEGVARVKRPQTTEFKNFTFDSVYDENTVQTQFYDQTGYAIVECVMDGYNGTIFAYGQTGTGKTHTMVGPAEPEELHGVIPRTFSHIFNNINMCPSKKFLVRASYLEIYNEEIRDLLSKNPKAKLELKDHPDGGVFVKDLSNLIVKGVNDLRQVMEVGQKNRSVASTKMNNESSRSHSIFTITIETSETGADSKDHIRVGKMNMVDLAGSERQSKTGASGDTLKEATKINMSLSALGNVISALVDSKSSFIPYRDSKLTRLLQDSLGGNTKTVMCACIGPVDYNYDETLSTLRYAYRAKSIKNKPKINEDPKDAMIREFQDEITRLRMQLANRAAAPSAAATTPKPAKVKQPKQPAAPQEPQEQQVIVEKEVVEVEKVIEVEKTVEKIVSTGVTEEDMAAIQANLEEERLQMEQAMAEEKRKIEEDQRLAEEDKQKLLEELQERKSRKEEEEKAHEQMVQKLKAMEDKMLVGTQVMEKAMQQESELRKAQMDMEEKRRAEQRMKEELEEQEQEKLNLEEKYASSEEQVQKMTAKLEKLWNRHKQTQQEVQDLQREFQMEREDMLESIRDLRKEVKLVCLTIENFIPMEHYKNIERLAEFDESTDEWVINNIDLAGNRVRPHRRRILDDGGDGTSPRALLRGPNPEGEHNPEIGLVNERPNVYFVYTEDGGAARAESKAQSSPPKPHKNQRTKSAGRPGTASRKGRAVKAGNSGPAATSMNFLHSPEPEGDDAPAAFPKARGLVRAA
uniref:Kinesin-like protein n=1 Tax=Alexandrium catenella TaxID=2925 RepID=A0A7S1SCL8_ALECA